MKNSFKLLTIAALGASTLFLNSCTEEPVDPIIPADPVCYMTQSSDDGDTTSYTYDSDNNVVSSINDGDTTIYEYSGGRLGSAYDGNIEATFIYTTGNVPSRINLREDGIDAGYWIVENTEGAVSKIEVHDASGQITQVTYATYDTLTQLTSLQVDSWDEDNEEFVTLLQVDNIMTDDKKNPFTTSFALIYANSENPLIYGNTNIVSGDVILLGNAFPLNAVHTYNTNDYPTATALTTAAGTDDYTYEFDCK